MTNPKILVTSAAGRTGSATALQLLEKGFPVRAFVRRRDARSAVLERAGAEITVGDLFDLRDLQNALIGLHDSHGAESTPALHKRRGVSFRLAEKSCPLRPESAGFQIARIVCSSD